MALARRTAATWLVVLAGLAPRLALIALATPWTQAHWFTPFLSVTASAPSPDPWTHFLSQGGDPMAFPYGPVYVLAYLPLTALGQALFDAAGAAFGLRLSVLVFDVATAFAIRRLAPGEAGDRASALYWLSPIAIYINYWHGQLDVLPVLILICALALLRENRFLGAAGAFAAATAAKFSMAMALPFTALYLCGAGRFEGARLRAGAVFAACLTLAAPFALSPGFRAMVLGTPETARLYELAIPVQPGIQLFALPVVLLGFFYVLWRVRRINFDISLAAIGAAFFCLILLTPPTPGWTMWVLPFLALHVARTGGSAWGLGAGFSLLFLLFHLSVATGAVAGGADLTAPRNLGGLASGARAHSILYSLYFMFGVALLAQMLWRGVFTNPFYRATRKPLLIGIAGDSGVGKDTLAEAIAGLFGPGAVCRVSGDDYHNWDRSKPMWRALTHLNPRSNDLEQFDADVRALAAGRHIRSRHYDHGKGAMTKPQAIRSREVIVASALHALYRPEVSVAYDLRVFLEMDESLRRHFKICRDVTVRGHSMSQVMESIERREADGVRFIRPQKASADIVLALTPARAVPPEALELEDAGPLRLHVDLGSSADNGGLERVLIGLCGLDVSRRAMENGREEMIVCGEPGARDVEAAGRALAPDFIEHLAVTPVWQPGLTGIMQLIVLRELARVARKRALATT